MTDLSLYGDALVVLGTAGVVVPLVRYWGINPILAFLAAGAALGPLGLGTLVERWPALHWVTIGEAGSIGAIAELGVVFLLFLIGTELSLPRLLAMRRLVFGLGGLQIGITATAIGLSVAAAGQSGGVAILLGVCLAMSSTAIVLELLSQQGRMTTNAGRASFAILLAQDLAVVPLLIYVSILGGAADRSLAATIAATLVEMAVALGAILVAGRYLLRPLLRLVAGFNSSELFVAAVLFVIVGTGTIAAGAGLSMALGAFLAGLMLAESEYRKTIEISMGPFKGLLIGVFFFTVGMTIDPREMARAPHLLVAAILALIAIKAAILVVLGRGFRLSWRSSVETALLLGPGGEFALIALGLAATSGLIDRPTASFALAVVSLTMVLIPGLSLLARRLAPYLVGAPTATPELLAQPAPMRGHAVVIGYGRVGKLVASLLREHGVRYVASDHDAATVTHDRRHGHEVFYGDAAHPEFLRACGLADAATVIVTIDGQATVDAVVRQIKAIRPEVPIVARARDADHATHLYSVGVTDAVPETIESSLQLAETALVELGIPVGKVIADIHERREQYRARLRQAASDAGRPAGRPMPGMRRQRS